MLTSYQTSVEEQQNQQLLVRLVLSHFQAQTLERQAQQCADSLLEEDSGGGGKASKRKLKKERQKKRQEAEHVEEHVAWDERQELALLSQMGWSSNGGGGAVANGGSSADAAESSPGSNGGDVDLYRALAMDSLETSSVELTESELREFDELAQHKGQLMEERLRMREALKQRFEEFCIKQAQSAT